MCVTYVKNLLTNRQPKPEFEEDLFLKKSLHEARMKEEIIDDEPVLTRRRFEATWHTLKATKKEKYKFIFGAGPDIKEALYALFSVVWRTEKCPEEWDKTKIIQIFKAGLVEDLDNYRNIHIKSEAGKMFSHLVVSKIKERITNNMSEFQVAKPGHRPQENLFVLKSIMALHEKYK